jgi:hypothetical protein
MTAKMAASLKAAIIEENVMASKRRKCEMANNIENERKEASAKNENGNESGAGVS